MLPDLIDLIIIFEKLGDGDLSAVYFALMRWGLFYCFLFCGGPIRLIILSSLYIIELFIVFEHIVCSIVGIAGDIF